MMMIQIAGGDIREADKNLSVICSIFNIEKREKDDNFCIEIRFADGLDCRR